VSVLPDATRVAAVALRAREPGELAALYTGVLGAPEDLVRLTAVDPGEPMPVDAHATGLFHVALRFGTRAHLAQALRRVADAGVALSGASDHGVSEALYLTDAEGNGVELYWDRDRAEWPRDGDGRISMFTDRLDLRGLLAEPEPAEPAVIDIGHVHLKVSALDPAVAFWSDAVGFELQQRFGPQAAFAGAGGYHHHVGMNTWHSRGAATPSPTTAGLDHVVVEVPDREALVALAARLQETGAPVEHVGVDEIHTSDFDDIGLRVVVA
jgi:catechol 2,3-dioxygenase